MKKFIFLFLIIDILTSCADKKILFFSNNKNLFFQKNEKKNSTFNILINQFNNNIKNIWGVHETLNTTPKDYIRYSNKYYTRSHINFDLGKINIETIAKKNITNNLRKAIISILLVSDNPNNQNVKKKSPLLYGQVLDQNGFPIRFFKQAYKFANYLIENKLKYRLSEKKIIWSIAIPMEKNHLNKRIHKYLPIIYKASKKYNVEKSLILAIMQIESSFNPYAESYSDALGLMQIVQGSAGLDVFRMKKKWGKPSKKYLLDPEKNIDMGAAYLSLLQKNYLSGILNPLSLRYAVITAYNSGAKSVLRIFSNQKNMALKKINSMSPKQVYQILIHFHPSIEARHYLYKVYQAQNQYLHF